VDEMSQGHFFDLINSSNADFLVAALGARKGQLWLLQNHSRLRVPIRAHLGAVINFQAGTVERAPYAVQKLGLEWLWRIKEEPSLFGRYWHDGCVLLRLLLTRVLPIAIRLRWLHLRADSGRQDLVISSMQKDNEVTVTLSGYATATRVSDAIACFREALASGKQVVVDLSQMRALDARFLGLFLMLSKEMKADGSVLHLIGVSSGLRRQFRLNGLEYLLATRTS
jgi:N-acetylglucosaminyldiphosphoundecaprenol N-acetyl-beta-D-mannosaminyltransferase